MKQALALPMRPKTSWTWRASVRATWVETMAIGVLREICEGVCAPYMSRSEIARGFVPLVRAPADAPR